MSHMYSGGYAGRIAHLKGGDSGYTLECEEDEFLPDSYVPRHARAGSREEEAHREDETFEERQFMEQHCVSDLVGSDTLKPTKSEEQARLRSPVSRKSDKVRFENEINQNGRSYSGATVTTRPEVGKSNSQSNNQRSVTSGIRGQQAFNIDQVKISHLVEQSTSILAKYLHRIDGISELTGCLRKEVGFLGLGKKGPHLQSAVQQIVKHEDFDVALHRVYGPSKRKVERVKKSIWRRVILLSNCDRKAKLKMLLSETSPSYPKS